MCGITGYFSKDRAWTDLSALYKATSLLSHRGPDDEGYAAFNVQTRTSISYCGPDSPASLKAGMPNIVETRAFEHHLAFGFRRFSVVDLSEKGHQPFWSADRNVCLLFNGEIYNHVEIRRELEKLGRSFGTTCDTEVLLVGYQQWGMEILKRCNGPIAMVLYDKLKNRLFMARDRVGKAPLYFTVRGGILYWGSEIKSIFSMAGQSAFSINEQAVYDYLNYGWRDLGNTTFWNEVQTLPAASWTQIDLSSTPSLNGIQSNLQRYWAFPQERLETRDIPFSEAAEQFRDLFVDAVRIRARADAKVVFSLSGGLDSSSIVAAAANIVPGRFQTYSIKFPGQPYDEEIFARTVYERYPDKIDYQIYTPQSSDFWRVADDFVWLAEEPFHWPDIEQFQAYLRQARADGCKVVLVGGGGDELLAGYDDYFFPFLLHLRQKNALLPLATSLFSKRRLWPRYCIRKRFKILNAFIHGDQDFLRPYFAASFLNRSGKEAANPYLHKEILANAAQRDARSPLPDFSTLATDYMGDHLMNYWMRNTEKAHFGVPIESRRPYLDYRLIDFVFTLPPEYIIHQGWTKYILRKSMNQWLPKKVAWRRVKQGMPFNTEAWFSHAKPVIESHLKTVQDNPFLNVKQIVQDYDQLFRKDPYFLWRAVSLGLWWKRVVLQRPLA
ncbi:MAG: asparagine synthase (glutamine-hydrolyzing) [Planctomycetaceae bacterium]|nr:asparagine synthase (glutamine-hydrolyzing) [Planctomycetaceae bacterium]